MATSGSKSVVVTAHDTLKFSWSENSQSIANNTTTIGWKMELIADSSGRIDSSTSKTWAITVNGTKYSGTNTVGIANNATKTLASGTTTITHNANGTKTFSYSFSQSFSGITFSGTSLGTKSGSGSGTLDTIPRASSLTASNGTLGTAQTLTINRADSDFSHTITYECGSASGTIATKTTSTSVSFTPPISLASQNTTGTSVSIVFTLTTYSHTSGATIGTATKTITCSIPESVKPTCSVSITDAMGYESTYGNPIKGLSKFKVVVTPTLAQGSPIASYSTTANGTKYTAASFTTDVLTSAGTSTVSATVKDKRGRTGSASASKTVLDYTEPVIIKLTVKRCNADGSANDQGEYVQATFSTAVTALNSKNKAEYLLKYKKSTQTNFTEIELSSLSGVYAVTDQTYIFPADSGSSYDVEFNVTDNFKTTKRTTSASTGFTLMHFKADGTGMAIGKVAEESNLFDVGLPARFNGHVSGNVMGLNKLPEIPAGSDLNDYMTIGCYAVHRNANAETIANMPVKRAGRLEVSSATGEGIRVSEWSYIRQRFIPYNVENAVWERDITRSADNVWVFYDWVRTSLSKTASDRVYREPKVLWEGGYFMTASHVANLSEAISAQNNGIVLVFSAYTDNAKGDYWWHQFFVPKHTVASAPGAGHCFTMASGNFSLVCMKYLMISDTKITGHSNNDLTGSSASGITFTNNRFVLRRVIGV